MAKPLVSDELWEIVQPLLPAPKPRRFRNPGRQRLDDRKDPVSSTGQALVEALPPVRGPRGRPRRRPQRLYADRADDSRWHRQELRRRHIAPSLARRGAEHGSKLGVPLGGGTNPGMAAPVPPARVHYERRADIHEAFLYLGCSVICFRRLTSFC